MLKVKKVDSIIALLFFFIFFLSLLLIYLIKISNDIDEYNRYHDNIVDLKLLDKSFDNFLLKKSTFINYDDINKKIHNFEKRIEFLDSRYSHQLFGSKYQPLLENVKTSFHTKQNFIENFKSNHASLLNSIHYIFDLQDVIETSASLTNEIKKIVGEETLLLMRYYVNSFSDKKKIKNNLKLLKQDFQNKKDNIELELFILNIAKNIQRIEKSNRLQSIHYGNGSLIENINELHAFLEKTYKKKAFIQKVIAIIFFLIALIILFILIGMYKRSLQIKNELLGFKSAVENSDNSIIITDADKNITFVNHIFEKETGYKKEEVLGENPRVLKSGQMPQEVYDELNLSLDKGKQWKGEFINVRKDHSYYYERASITPIYVDGELKNYLAIKLNITDYIEQQKEVEFLALHDPLTKLPNRTNVECNIEKKIKLAQRNNSKMIALFIDMDRFKTINDTLGHDVGDEVIIETSRRLQNSLRDSDVIARVGGDEFLVILESLNDDMHAGKVCEKIMQSFSEPIQVKEYKLNMTLSIGISIYPNDALDYQTLLKNADIAMYQAKKSGKNTFRYYQEELSREVKLQLNIEQSFNGALDRDEFYLMYQPQYTLEDKKVVGLEALVRWENDSLGFIPPDKFIPVAEDTSFILELGKFIFRQACTDFLEFKKHSSDLETISINISAVQLYQESFLNDILSVTKELNILSKSIIIEITETYIMKDIDHTMMVLNELKKVGFGISIDDFGTGHSSLSYLKQFPLTELKIDKAFIDGIPDDENDVVITQVIIGLSKNLEYINVAEGIENEKQEEFLRKNSCSLGQGYYFCKPKRKDELIEFLDLIKR